MFQGYHELDGKNSFHHYSKETGFPDWKKAKEYPECIFVFGSNLGGLHGLGAAPVHTGAAASQKPRSPIRRRGFFMDDPPRWLR